MTSRAVSHSRAAVDGRESADGRHRHSRVTPGRSRPRKPGCRGPALALVPLPVGDRRARSRTRRAALDRPRGARRQAGDARAGAQRERRDVDLARGCARSPARRRAATSSGVLVPDARRQLGAGVGEHARVAHEAREHAATRRRRARRRSCRSPSANPRRPNFVAAVERRAAARPPCPTARRRTRGGPSPRATIGSTSSRASTIGARRLTASARSISLEREASSARRSPAAPALDDEHVDVAGLRQQPLGRVGLDQVGDDRARRRARRPARSSTSARRPVSTTVAPARGQARARSAWPSPPRRAGEQDGPPAEVHAAKTATVAVKPCTKYSPPTGPISPAAKKPAAGRAAELVVERRRRRGGRGRTCRRRARCTRTAARRPAAGRRAPSCARRARRAGRGRRCRRRARAGARPGRAAPALPTATWPVSGSAPTSPRTRKSPCT